MSEKEPRFSNPRLAYLSKTLRAVATDQYDFNNLNQIEGLLDTLQSFSDSNFHDDDSLPITEEQVSILGETIRVLVPLIRKGYFILESRYKQRDKDNMLLGSNFPMTFSKCRNYHAYQNFFSFFKEDRIYKDDEDTYLKIHGIGVRGEMNVHTYAISGSSETLISEGKFCISLTNMNKCLYIATDREVVVQGVPLFKKKATFNRVDLVGSNLMNEMLFCDYKQAMKWLLCACIKTLMAVMDTNRFLNFVEDNSIHRGHTINFD